MSPLALMKEGESAEIVGVFRRFCSGQKNCGKEGHLADMGLRPGRRIEMVANQGGGPLVLRLDETRIALGRATAMKIYVRRKEA